MMRRFRNAEQGFTLIELAIVIAIIGLVGVAGLQMLGGTMRNAQLRTTQDRLDLAVGAVLAFMAEKGRLPCPANGSLAPGATGYGLEVSSCTGMVVTQGVLPWRTLGLPDLSAQDGWTRLLSYRVTTALTLVGGGGGAGTLDIQYQDSVGTTAAQAAFLIFSHGNNGLGAWTTAGARLATTGASTTEQENLDTDAIYVARAQTPPATDSYDDFLVWRTSAQIAQTLGIFPLSTCSAASSLKTASGCTASSTTDACTVANAVLTRCP